jgi:hypothetical protein
MIVGGDFFNIYSFLSLFSGTSRRASHLLEGARAEPPDEL